MLDSPHIHESADHIVRERLAYADRLRRTRESSRQVWRMAPVIAAAALGLALLSQWAGLPTGVPIVVLVAGMCALLSFALTGRRRAPVSDAAATTIDADAGMRGELRSASWFAARDARDPWAEFHLTAAAERLQRVNWTDLYPRARAARPKLTTAVFAIATLALTVAMPERVRVAPGESQPAPAATPDVRRQGPVPGTVLDPELQKLLEDLLAAAASGKLPSAEAMAADPATRELLNKMNQLSNAELLEALKRALEANPEARARSVSDNLKKLSEQARRAVEGGSLPKEIQDALEKLSDEIEIAKGDEAVLSDDASADASGGSQQGQMSESGDKAGGQELSIEFARAAEAGAGAGMMMMSNNDTSQPGGAGGSGVGGAGSDEMAASAQAIEAVLKKETVAASADTAGKNVDTDIRRKSDQGNAAVGFTGGASGTFDRTRAAAPPPVPEARRSGVQTYFVRKP